MPTARSTPNIALVKYWGNRDNTFRLCAADSLSMTLDGPHVDVTVEKAEGFSVRSTTKELNVKEIARFAKTLDLINTYMRAGGTHLPPFAITIDSKIPPAIGLASSSAVFSAFAKAVAGLINAGLSDEQISVMARLGSGSAARSVFGGYGAIRNLPGNAIGDAVGYQVADETHWPLHDIIIVPSVEEKKTGSTEGHASAWTSPMFKDRVAAIPRRMKECTDAILQKDFEKLQRIAEEDCMDMHRCMQTQNPPLNYLSSETLRIVEEIKALRKTGHLPVLYTMDAGATVHLFCTDEAADAIRHFARAQKGCAVFQAKTGKGTQIVNGELSW